MKAKWPLPRLQWAAFSLAVAAASAFVSAQRGEVAGVRPSAPPVPVAPPREAAPVRRAAEPAFETRARQLQAASLADLPGLYDDFRRLPWPERDEALTWLCTRWVELDAENGWAFLVSRGRSGHLPGFLTAWALRDPVAAAAHLDPDRGGVGALQGSLTALTRTNPQCAMSLLQAVPAALRKSALSVGSDEWWLATLTQRDPHRVVDWLSAAGSLDHPAWRSVASGMKDLPFAEAWKLMAEAPAAGRAAVLEAFVRTRTDDAAALRAFVSDAANLSSTFRSRLLGTLLTAEAAAKAKDDPIGALSWLQEEAKQQKATVSVDRMLMHSALKAALADGSPDALARVLDNSGPDEGNWDIYALPGAEFRPLFGALVKQPAGPARDRMLGEVADELGLPADQMLAARQTVEDALALKRMDQALLRSILRAPSQADPAALTPVANGLAKALADRIEWGNATAGEAPAGAALILQMAGSVQDGPLGEVAAGLARLGSQQALDFLARLPAERQPTVAAAMVGQWAVSEPMAASTWLAQQSGETRTAGAVALATTLADKEPDSAFAWAESLPSGATRVDTLRTVVIAWAARDAAGVAQRVKSSNLPPKEKSALLEGLPKR